MRVPFKRPLVPGDRVRVVKGQSRHLCVKFGKVFRIEDDEILIILDCGHPYSTRSGVVVLDGSRRCIWCRGSFLEDQVKPVPFWNNGGEVCGACWAELEIDKHIKRISATEKISKPKRKARVSN